MTNENVIQKLEEVVETLRNQSVEENQIHQDEWNDRRSRFCTAKKDRYIVRWGWGDNKSYFSSYEEARNWIDKDIAGYSGESPIPEYAIDREETYTIEFITPRKKRAVKTGFFSQQRAPDGEYKGITDVWVE